jgi:nitrate/nitrite transport system permease protein
MRLSMGVAWMVIVAVEILLGQGGIGFYVWDSYNAGSYTQITAAVLVIGSIGLLLDQFFLRLARAAEAPEVQS